jgi:membrane-bound ClpP family serine protease
MPGVTKLISYWRAALALLLMGGLLWLANDQHSQSPAGVVGLFGFSLFISLGFILFGQQRFEPSTTNPSAEDQHLA